MRERLAALLAAYAGLDPPPWAVEARLRERAAALGLDEDDYLRQLEGDSAELGRLVELLRVGETRFFRHRAQLETLAERVLASSRGALRAWSAGCSSGEEAWTLAMLLCERGRPFSLLATDLSPTALARAQRGAYPAARVTAEVPAPLVARYFRRVGDELVVHERLRALVRFGEHNLLSPPPLAALDLLLCRNVLIYFDDDKRAEVVTKLVGALAPGGWLLVGYSETLRDCPQLTSEAHSIYRKLGAVDARAVTEPPPPVTEPAPPAIGTPRANKTAPPAIGMAPPRRRTHPLSFRSAGERLPRIAPALRPPSALHPPLHAPRSRLPTPLPGHGMRVLELRGDYADGTRLLGELRPLVGGQPTLIDLDGASFLGDEAARVLKRAAEAEPRLQLRATRPAVRRWLARHGIRQR